MKRLLAFLLISIFAFTLQPSRENKLFDCEKIDKVCIISSADLSLQNGITSGNQYYFYTDKVTAKQKFKQNRRKIDGICLYFSNLAYFNEIIDYYKISYYQGSSVEGYKIFYGYSPFYNDCYNLNNKRQNVQIAVTENQIILGFPAILCGF